MAQWTIRGLSARASSKVRPSFASAAERMLTTMMSADSSSGRIACRPSGDFRSIASERLLRFIWMNFGES